MEKQNRTKYAEGKLFPSQHIIYNSYFQEKKIINLQLLSVQTDLGSNIIMCPSQSNEDTVKLKT